MPSLLPNLLRARTLAHSSALASCDDIDTCRTEWSIVWSCLTTIFLCTWVAIHPNIPEPVEDEKGGFLAKLRGAIRNFIKDRLLLFVVAILVPEYILAWAIRQRLVADSIAKKNKKLGLTTVHGFFIIMGGYYRYERQTPPSHNEEQVATLKITKRRTVKRIRGSQSEPDPLDVQAREVSHIDKSIIESELGQTSSKNQGLNIFRAYLYALSDDSDNEETSKRSKEAKESPIEFPVHPLGRKDVVWLAKEGKMKLATEAEIVDKSKSDWLAKILVVIQTLWFVSQCIGRVASNLPMTILEIVTLVYTIINLGIYLAWWYKPNNVTAPVRVFTGVPETPSRLKDFQRHQYALYDLGRTEWERNVSFAWKAMLGDLDELPDLDNLKKVPTFYSGDAGDLRITQANGMTLMMGLVAGTIHCIAWSFQFSSHSDLMVWRWSSSAIIIIPVCLFVIGAPISLLWPEGIPLKEENIIDRVLITLAKFMIVQLPILASFLYIVARVATLVVAFFTLRSLPPGAYWSVQWADFIPHI